MEKVATRQITFDVPGLGEPAEASCCASPTETIAESLRRIPGVGHIEVDACCQRVAVDYDPTKATVASLAAVLEDLGYLGTAGADGPAPSGA